MGKRAVILKSRIELARAEARNFIEGLAVQIKRDAAPNQPLGTIILSLRRGLCDCAAAMENMKEE